ncbi:hypothetical protein Poli38472_008954 [Pythium oligandrum]|uniref:Uncharacterized protein n=1 Tax=Pythium oligandrum TaxID=41045 RepID=A0A8K1C4J2_PYTOL|nr:hypothetical protein Poli38472_008954 [Pythium oligandrum]|eukprot:TMW56306.1 hypothetical protein Poli38472_008954 [Pythium oligandrum]
MKTAVKLVLCAVALLSLNGPSVTEATFRGLQAGKHKDCDSGLEPVPTPAPTFDKPTPAPSGPSTKNPTPAPSASTTPAPTGGKPTPAPSGSNSSPVQTSAPAPTSGKPVPSPTGNSPVPTPISNAPAPTSNPAPSSSSGPAPTSSGPTPAPSSAPPSTPTPVPSSVTPTTWKLDEIHDHTGKDCNGNIVSNMKQNVTDPGCAEFFSFRTYKTVEKKEENYHYACIKCTGKLEKLVVADGAAQSTLHLCDSKPICTRFYHFGEVTSRDLECAIGNNAKDNTEEVCVLTDN